MLWFWHTYKVKKFGRNTKKYQVNTKICCLNKNLNVFTEAVGGTVTLRYWWNRRTDVRWVMSQRRYINRSSTRTDETHKLSPARNDSRAIERRWARLTQSLYSAIISLHQTYSIAKWYHTGCEKRYLLWITVNINI